MNRNRKSEPQSSLVSALTGIFMICFGVVWTFIAASMAPFMAIFGILWTAIAAVSTYNSYKEAKKREEMNENDYDEYGAQFEHERAQTETESLKELRCPYCGAPIKSGDTSCEYCGSKF